MSHPNSMANILDIIRRVATSPDKVVKDILTKEDFACLARCVSGIELPANKPSTAPALAAKKPVFIIRKPTKV